MKILISGSRTITDYETFKETLLYVMKGIKYNNPNITRDDVEFVFGEAKGIDTIAKEFCDRNGYQYKVFYADWNTHGKSAGFIRNRLMGQYLLDSGEQCLVVAIWDGKSPGTKSMIDLAKAMKIDLIYFNQLDGNTYSIPKKT